MQGVSADSGFRKREEQTLLEGGLISVATGTFESPTGDIFERTIVHHPGAVSVVPLLNDETFVLVHQFRAAVNGSLLEIPAGKRDVAGEPPETTAARELEEEIGMRAGRLHKLAEFYNSPGFCDEYAYVFLGLDLAETKRDLQGIEEQHMTIEHVAVREVPRLIADTIITDAKTIIGLTLALRYLGR